MSAIKIQNELQRRRRSSHRGLLMQPRPDLPVVSDGETQFIVQLHDRTQKANRECRANVNTWILSKAAAMIKLWLVCVLSTVVALTPCTSRGWRREPAGRRWTAWRRSHLKSRSRDVFGDTDADMNASKSSTAPQYTGLNTFTFQNLKAPYYDKFSSVAASHDFSASKKFHISRKLFRIPRKQHI